MRPTSGSSPACRRQRASPRLGARSDTPCVLLCPLCAERARAHAQEALWKALRIVAEPAGAAAFAAVLSGKCQLREGERIDILLCGGNTNVAVFVR
jgi:threonine dehydratase